MNGLLALKWTAWISSNILAVVLAIRAGSAKLNEPDIERTRKSAATMADYRIFRRIAR
jgi:hypothetical protein